MHHKDKMKTNNQCVVRFKIESQSLNKIDFTGIIRCEQISYAANQA